jgi:hypothetical protein
LDGLEWGAPGQVHTRLGETLRRCPSDCVENCVAPSLMNGTPWQVGWPVAPYDTGLPTLPIPSMIAAGQCGIAVT